MASPGWPGEKKLSARFLSVPFDLERVGVRSLVHRVERRGAGASDVSVAGAGAGNIAPGAVSMVAVSAAESSVLAHAVSAAAKQTAVASLMVIFMNPP